MSAPAFELYDHEKRYAAMRDAGPELYEALADIKWKSADRDNMEFAATITYSQMDRIRTALAKARATQSPVDEGGR